RRNAILWDRFLRFGGGLDRFGPRQLAGQRPRSWRRSGGPLDWRPRLLARTRPDHLPRGILWLSQVLSSSGRRRSSPATRLRWYPQPAALTRKPSLPAAPGCSRWDLTRFIRLTSSTAPSILPAAPTAVCANWKISWNGTTSLP